MIAPSKDSPPTLCRFANVCKWYGSVIGLNDVSWDLQPGITGLVGHNALVEASDVEVSFSLEATEYHEVRANTRLEAVKAARKKAVLPSIGRSPAGLACTGLSDHPSPDALLISS